VHRRYGQGAEGTCHHQTVLVIQAATRHRRVHQPQPCGKCRLRCSSVWVTDVKEIQPVHPSHCQRSHPHNNTTAADGVPRPPHLGRVLRAKCCSLRHPHFTSTPCHAHTMPTTNTYVSTEIHQRPRRSRRGAMAKVRPGQRPALHHSRPGLGARGGLAGWRRRCPMPRTRMITSLGIQRRGCHWQSGATLGELGTDPRQHVVKAAAACAPFLAPHAEAIPVPSATGTTR